MTSIHETPTGLVVRSTDPATPQGRVALTGNGRHAQCPTCDARIYLRDTSEEGSEYQDHYWTEHTAPAIRYEETAQ